MRSSMVSARSPMSSHGVRSSAEWCNRWVRGDSSPVRRPRRFYGLFDKTQIYVIIIYFRQYYYRVVRTMNRRRFSDCCRGVRKDRYFASGESFHVRRIVSHSAVRASTLSRCGAGGVALRHVKNRNADPLPPRSSGRVGCTGSDDTRSHRAILLCRRRVRYRITNIVFSRPPPPDFPPPGQRRGTLRHTRGTDRNNANA